MAIYISPATTNKTKITAGGLQKQQLSYFHLFIPMTYHYHIARNECLLGNLETRSLFSERSFFNHNDKMLCIFVYISIVFHNILIKIQYNKVQSRILRGPMVIRPDRYWWMTPQGYMCLRTFIINSNPLEISLWLLFSVTVTNIFTCYDATAVAKFQSWKYC